MPKPKQATPVTEISRYANIALYGPPGIGKTRFIGTAKSALVLECGPNETDTISAMRSEGFDVSDIDVWDIQELQDLTEAYEYCRHEGYKDYDWVWIDSGAGLEGRLMLEELRNVHAKNDHRDLYVPDKAEYLKVQSKLDRFMGWFVALPMHFGVTSHVMIESIVEGYDEDGDEIQTEIMMPQFQGGRGKLAQKVCGYMNVVAYLTTYQAGENKEIPAMLVRGDGRHIAKDRYGTMANNTDGKWMLNPTIPKVEAAVARAISASNGKATGAKKVPAKKATAPATKKAAGLRKG